MSDTQPSIDRLHRAFVTYIKSAEAPSLDVGHVAPSHIDIYTGFQRGPWDPYIRVSIEGGCYAISGMLADLSGDTAEYRPEVMKTAHTASDAVQTTVAMLAGLRAQASPSS